MSGLHKEPEVLVDIAAKAAALAKQLLGTPDDIAEAFGSELAQMMADEWGGQAPYIASGLFYKVSKRHREIYEAFTGSNHPQLAKQFGMSRVWIYKIVARMRAADLATRQPDLFKPPDDPTSEAA